ncbi:ABC transporter permease [Cryptosporangium phraense]|uniref:ABC transporter permease n=1 Tax=Cryptosporangium phraense TaxID=2593070 RepID=A0A545ATK8_9ACTN|nr:ABC transporter permease [Cryptosporangium phraense]TQS44601.1 ABC transporter permease [Cryptosporangium phraense]
MTSVIHDLGYQRYTGPRLGRGYAFRTLYVHSLRTAFGLGRGIKAKIFSWSIISFILLAGLIVTVIAAQTGQSVTTSPMFLDNMTILSVLLLAGIAPELTSRDQQTRALSLYFARPLRRTDYALARLGGLVTALFLVLAAPVTLMFVGAALSTKKGADGITHAAGDWAAGLAHGATHAIVLSSISVLIASLIRRRAIAAAAIVAVFLVTTPAVAFTEALNASQGTSELVAMTNPPAALNYLGIWLYADDPTRYTGGDPIAHGPLLAVYFVVLSAACIALLVARYRKVPA